MTEQEAKQKWCPFARVTVVENGKDAPAANRVATPDQLRQKKTVPVGHCIGSACMAWRWTLSPHIAKELGDAESGYCGLAGKP